MRRCLSVFGLCLCAGVLVSSRSLAATFAVTKLDDAGAGSLRQALIDASATPGPHLIDIKVPGTIQLASSLPALTGALTIRGPVMGGTSTVRAPTAGGLVFQIDAGDVTLHDLRITGGAGLGAVRAANATILVERCVIEQNSSLFGGAGIRVANSHLTVRETLISKNVTTGSSGGGGVDATSSDVVVERSAVVGNEGLHGGVHVGGASGTLVVRGSTLSGNVARGDGAAIALDAAVTGRVETSTITSNQATGAGGGVFALAGPTALVLRSSIVAGNTAGSAPDLSGTYVSEGHNLVGVVETASLATAEGDLTGSAALPLDPRLSPLAQNGGLTPTHALLVDSPAIDRGGSLTGSAVDQRGASRVLDLASAGNAYGGAGMDVGAYELVPSLTIAGGPIALEPTPPRAASATKGLVITGGNLVADVTCAVDPPFAIAASDADTFDRSVTLKRDAAGALTSSVRVRFTPDDVTPRSALVQCTTDGVKATVPVDARSVVPTLSVDVGEISLAAPAAGVPSAPRPYLVEARDLLDDVTVRASAGFELSREEIGPFAATLAVARAPSGRLEPVRIWVRYVPNDESLRAGTIVHDSSAAKPVVVGVAGAIAREVAGIPASAAPGAAAGADDAGCSCRAAGSGPCAPPAGLAIVAAAALGIGFCRRRTC